MIHPCEASPGEEAKTQLETEGSTREAGDPQPKLESACDSKDCQTSIPQLSPIVGSMSDSLPRKTQDRDCEGMVSN